MSIPRFVYALAAILALASWSGCSRGQRAANAPAAATSQPVEVTAITRRDMSETINLVGSVAANETAEIRAEIAGQIREILFNEGERVTKGQVLVKIDDSELVAQVAQASAAFRLAELNLERTENLAKSSLISQADADSVRSEYASSKAALALLRIRLAKTQLKAPFDGIAGSRAVSVGDYVTSSAATAAITTINDLARLKIDFQVPERFLNKVKPRSPFIVHARAGGEMSQLTGEVYFVSAIIDRTSRSSEVKGFLTNPPEQIKPGMFANVELVLEVHRAVLAVPEGAVLVTPRGPQVILAVTQAGSTTADFVPVSLGLRSRGLVEIVPVDATRLREGSQVVAAGVGALILFPGAKLDPRPQRAEFSVGN
ncbi:MAG: czcB 2 [Verrucomicrobia bacterium]|nr:czcB 2 [Verrucomicrobiota bacterium]